ncbi:arylsulfatase [Altererythrobacter sp. BO-6]|uniref:sulfatase family protein n=1 Tax=Altererythrobacter sp. BO-6 TaxID=2604537 RepID=UPI0013E1B68E|nr:arylsulfatase [Altererythrobacter sp. BO-6]QIG53529.1 arylsulfatase [Altererythrobacter sp. BO-6]
MRHAFRLAATLITLAAIAACAPVDQSAPRVTAQADRPPNIIIFYADDLGYGDLGSYGAEGLPTPNVDRLAREGVRFTDGHAAAATCTPSRYALLTGEYGFRSKAEILPGDAPLLIRPDKYTIADMLSERGYRTAVIGKWHLGLGDGAVDWNAEVKPGPLEIGFDYSFLLPATGDRVPTAYLENHRIVGLDPADPLSVSYKEKIGDRPTGYENPELLRYKADRQHSDTIINGVSRIGHMKGGKSAEWVDEEFHQVFTEKAKSFIRESKDQPFFIYFAFHDPHVPRLPAKRFQGATTMGPRGDAIVQMDWMTGQIIAELERLGLDQNTLVIFSSDNGPVLNDGYEDGAVELLGNHKPAGPLRGGKYSAFEAGARVPTIAWWPGRIAPGTSNAVVSQVDLFASLASLTGAKLRPDVAIDSRNQLGAWLGSDPMGRDLLFKEWVAGLVLRERDLKFIAPLRNPDQAAFVAGKGIESGASNTAQLYDLSRDIGETRNLARDRPEDVSRMRALLNAIVSRTRFEGER